MISGLGATVTVQIIMKLGVSQGTLVNYLMGFPYCQALPIPIRIKTPWLSQFEPAQFIPLLGAFEQSNSFDQE